MKYLPLIQVAPKTPAIPCLLLFVITVAFILSAQAAASSVKHLKTQQRNEILFNIRTYYVEDLALQSSQFIDYNPSQFQRLYAKLDPYSKYLDEAALNAIFSDANDQYTGIGIEVSEAQTNTVISNVVAHSPAEQVGIKPGDIIVSVNHVEVSHKTIDEVADMIRDSKANTILLHLKRNHHKQPIKVAVSREKITLHSVSSQLLDAGTGYIAINRFSNHTKRDVQAHIADLNALYGQPLKGLVIDLRDNPGGTLQSAVDVADLFLQRGIIVSTRGRYDDANHTYYASKGDILADAAIVVLINENSASAAEIVAAALKDNQRATLLGRQSFGKGSVQSLIPLGTGNTAIKLTTAKYFTPSGKSIDGVGVTPDVPINQTMLSQTNKLAIINQQRAINMQLFSEKPFDLQVVKAKQLLSMQ